MQQRESLAQGCMREVLEESAWHFRPTALVGIYRQLKIPIYFVGLGEQAEDLQPFSVDNYARAVFGLDG